MKSPCAPAGNVLPSTNTRARFLTFTSFNVLTPRLRGYAFGSTPRGSTATLSPGGYAAFPPATPMFGHFVASNPGLRKTHRDTTSLPLLLCPLHYVHRAARIKLGRVLRTRPINRARVRAASTSTQDTNVSIVIQQEGASPVHSHVSAELQPRYAPLATAPRGCQV